MTPRLTFVLACCLWLLLEPTMLRADDAASFTRQEDVIYGRKFGTALTLDVITPKENKNGVGLVWVVSGGWYSGHQAINAAFVMEFLKRGYTVFAVVHGSQPKFRIPEVVSDMNRSIRFIRNHAAEYGIDPERIGIFGASAGGHLSLMIGSAGSAGAADSDDSVEKESSRVQAVACYFPPTDFLNYGKEGEIALGTGILVNFRAPFDFEELNPKTRAFDRITDESRRIEIGREISPITHVTADDPPTLIIHGDADTLVPIQQAQIFVDKMKQVSAVAELVTKPGAGHGWPNLVEDNATLADWFDQHLSMKSDSHK